MGEWASWGLSDFLMFSPQAWQGLLERYNAALWPAHGPALLLGGVLLGLAGRQEAAARRTGLLVLAGAWAFSGAAFHAQWHAEIFLGAVVLAWSAAGQALLLAMAAMAPAPAGGAGDVGRLQVRSARAVLALAVLGWPLLAPASGRGWSAVEVFGLMPDPTALATLGWLLAPATGAAWARALLALLPALNLLFGLATRWALAQ